MFVFVCVSILVVVIFLFMLVFLFVLLLLFVCLEIVLDSLSAGLEEEEVVEVVEVEELNRDLGLSLLSSTSSSLE